MIIFLRQKNDYEGTRRIIPFLLPASLTAYLRNALCVC